MKNKLRGLLVFIIIAGIFYLTFQSPSETTELSSSFWQWLADHGINWDKSTIRSDAHLPMYFVLGFALCLWLGWKKSLVTGPVIGTIDETIKIILPTRHFDFFDLCRDCIGIAAGVLVVCLWRKLLYRNKPVY